MPVQRQCSEDSLEFDTIVPSREWGVKAVKPAFESQQLKLLSYDWNFEEAALRQIKNKL